MLINLYEIVKKEIPSYMIERSYSYFLNLDVLMEDVSFIEENKLLIKASVYGTNEYTVQIYVVLDEDKKVKLDYNCTCPAYEKFSYCKHIPAVILEFMFNYILIEKNGKLDFIKLDIDEIYYALIHIAYGYYYKNVNKSFLNNLFLQYIEKRHLSKDIKEFFDEVYAYSKKTIADYLKKSDLIFENKKQDSISKDEDKLYKVKINYSEKDDRIYV